MQLGPAATIAATIIVLVAGALSPGSGIIPASSTGQSGGGLATPSGRGAVITIPLGAGDNESSNFRPARIVVVVGVNNTVLWNDTDAVQHTVRSMSVPAGASPFYSTTLNQGQTFAVILTVPGTYTYECTIHPDWMRGTIQVLP